MDLERATAVARTAAAAYLKRAADDLTVTVKLRTIGRPRQHSDETILAAVEARGGDRTLAARDLGLSVRTIDRALAKKKSPKVRAKRGDRK